MKRRRKILLRMGSIGVTNCWWRVNRGGIDVCVYGSGFWSGCSSDCNYASVPNYAELLQPFGPPLSPDLSRSSMRLCLPKE